MTHKCYSCHNNFEYKDLEYECMCYNNDTIKYRGICKRHTYTRVENKT